jgi:hypothetical protein
MRHPSRRNALTLIIVLAVMALIAGVVVALTHQSAAMHQQLRHQRLQATARYGTHSAIALVHRNPELVSSTTEPFELEMESLLAGGLKGTGVIQCITIDDTTSCEIDIRLRQSRHILRRRTPATIRPSPEP